MSSRLVKVGSVGDTPRFLDRGCPDTPDEEANECAAWADGKKATPQSGRNNGATGGLLNDLRSDGCNARVLTACLVAGRHLMELALWCSPTEPGPGACG